METVNNLASRLCGEPKPGQILVSRRLLGAMDERVEVEPVGERPLKGFRRLINAYCIVRMKRRRGRRSEKKLLNTVKRKEE